MNEHTYYVIRHKPTGFLLPQHSRKKEGYTWSNPENPEHFVPRLFTRRQDAKTALTWWLKGITSRSFVRTDGWFSEVDEVWKTSPITESDIELGYIARRAEDMEVVEVALRWG